MVEIDPIIRVALLRPCDSECYGLRTKSMFEALLEQGSNNMSENSSRIVVEEFDVINLKYPDENELGLYASFVIVGSLASAYDDHPWTEKLLDFIRRLHLENRRVLGVCFGHQIIARAMGGKVRKVPAGTQYGVRSTCLTDEGRKFFEDIEKESVSFIYTHGDEVIELPVGATSIGGNDIVPVHGMVFDGGNMVTLQGHPEFSTDPGELSLHAIADYNEKQPEYNWIGKEAFLENVNKTPTDSDVLIQRITTFLTKR